MILTWTRCFIDPKNDRGKCAISHIWARLVQYGFSIVGSALRCECTDEAGLRAGSSLNSGVLLGTANGPVNSDDVSRSRYQTTSTCEIGLSIRSLNLKRRPSIPGFEITLGRWTNCT